LLQTDTEYFSGELFFAAQLELSGAQAKFGFPLVCNMYYCMLLLLVSLQEQQPSQ